MHQMKNQAISQRKSNMCDKWIRKNTKPGNEFINLINILKENKHMYKSITIPDKLNKKRENEDIIGLTIEFI